MESDVLLQSMEFIRSKCGEAGHRHGSYQCCKCESIAGWDLHYDAVVGFTLPRANILSSVEMHGVFVVD